MSIRDTVTYTPVPGSNKDHHVRVYALSTCGFCEKAMVWLKDQEINYEYIFIDNLDIDIKRGLKAELKERFGNLSVFPVMVVDHDHCIQGFTEEKYTEGFAAIRAGTFVPSVS